MLRFEYLPEVILRKHHRIFLLSGLQNHKTDLQQISAYRQVWAMLFQDTERQKTGSL